MVWPGICSDTPSPSDNWLVAASATTRAARVTRCGETASAAQTPRAMMPTRASTASYGSCVSRAAFPRLDTRTTVAPACRRAASRDRDRPTVARHRGNLPKRRGRRVVRGRSGRSEPGGKRSRKTQARRPENDGEHCERSCRTTKAAPSRACHLCGSVRFTGLIDARRRRLLLLGPHSIQSTIGAAIYTGAVRTGDRAHASWQRRTRGCQHHQRCTESKVTSEHRPGGQNRAAQRLIDASS